MKLEKELINTSKTFKGHVIGVGINDKISDALFDNKKIVSIDILSALNDKNLVFEKGESTSYLPIKDLRKHFGKKKIDYIICDFDHIKKYAKYFIKDSIYMAKNTIYMYASDIDDYLLIEKRYGRYNINITGSQFGKQYLIKIVVGKTKNNLLKDAGYYILDNISNLGEYIGDIIAH